MFNTLIIAMLDTRSRLSKASPTTLSQLAKVKQWETLVKETFSQLPYTITLLQTDKDCIFGSFLQTIYENLHLKPEELITLHFITLKKDLDIRIFNDITNFFRQVCDAGGCIEFAGTLYCTKYTRMSDKLRSFGKIDLSKHNPRIPKGNYWVYIKFKDGWIKYDISYLIEKPEINLDFVANGLTYPVHNDLVQQSWNLCAMIDIDAKRITPVKEILTPKILCRATKLLAKGYQFEDPKYLERMVSRVATAYFPQTVMFESTDKPSIEPKGAVIRATEHPYFNPRKLPDDYAKFITKDSSMHGSEFNFGSEKGFGSFSGNKHGILTKTITFYRPAIITKKGTRLEWVQYNTRDDEDQLAVIVQLQVAEGTTFKSRNRKTYIEFCFDGNILVKDILGFYDKSVYGKIMEQLKDSPFTFSKNKSRTYTKSDEDNFLYPCTAWAQCKHLKVIVDEN